MTQALRQLAEDFLSAILFFAVYAATGSLYAGVAIAIGIGFAQLLRLRLKQRSVEPMQWLSLGLVIVLGAATLLLHSPRLMMMKPSVVHLAFAAIMLRRGWLRRYLPAIAQQHVPDRAIIAAGYGWAALMASLGVANLAVALVSDLATWAWFISFGVGGAKIAALLVQYAVFRAIVRRELRAARLPGAEFAGARLTVR